MAYAFTVERESHTKVDGRKYTILEIEEVDAVPTSEWSAEVPEVGKITLVECTLVTPGTSTTIQPEFGRLAGWTSAAEGHIDQVAAAGTTVRVGTDKRWATDGTLYGRSTPDAGIATLIRTRITFMHGHD